MPRGRARHQRRSAAALRGVASLSRQHERRLGVPARVRVRTAVRSTSRVDASDGLIGRLRVSDGARSLEASLSLGTIGLRLTPLRPACYVANAIDCSHCSWSEVDGARPQPLGCPRTERPPHRAVSPEQRPPAAQPEPTASEPSRAFPARSGHGRRDLLWWVSQHPGPCLKELGPPRFGTRAGSNPPWLPTSIRNSLLPVDGAEEPQR